MSDVVLAHTAELPEATLAAARALLVGVFGQDLSDEDWEHGLGGMHALVWDEGELVGHGSVVQRRLLHGGRALRTGYVEGVGVRADRRRRGHATALMQALGRVIRGAYVLGALGASDQGAPLYASLGWQRWRGPLFALTPDGIRRTASEEGVIHVLEAGAGLDLDGE